jgi:hypothetical protein
MKLIAIACLMMTATAACWGNPAIRSWCQQSPPPWTPTTTPRSRCWNAWSTSTAGTMNLAGVRQVGDVFSAQLRTLGFTTRWIDGAPFNRAGHLVAERARQGPRVLLIATSTPCSKPTARFNASSA